jgi:hypothetical protein
MLVMTPALWDPNHFQQQHTAADHPDRQYPPALYVNVIYTLT